ncbi:hypothetical protein DFH07DRAFT_735517, partial [Mycena maculata]
LSSSSTPPQYCLLTHTLRLGDVRHFGSMNAPINFCIDLYFLAFPTDRRIWKGLVVFIFVAEIMETLGDSRDTIRIFGAGWGNFQLLDEVGWAWFSVPILLSPNLIPVACLGQIFFAWRIYIIGHKTLYVPVAIALVTAVQWGAGIWSGVQIWRAGRFSLLQFRYLHPPVAWLAATALSDLLIVGGTVFYITKARQPDFRHINGALSRIIKVNATHALQTPQSLTIQVTVETGVLCALSAIIVLVLFVKFEGNNYHLGVCIWLSKVYSNSIMVVSASPLSCNASMFDVTSKDPEFPSAHQARRCLWTQEHG